MGIKERQERDREAVRRSILDAARELFVTEGYRNVSIRKIAEKIEYSPAAIYGYFPSKDDIFYALAEEGFRLLYTRDDAVAFAHRLREAGCDIVDVSTGQVSPDQAPAYGRSYQTPYADRIRHEAGIPVIAVGAISSYDDVNTIILAGRADLCALARPHLWDPHWTLHAAADQGVEVDWIPQYRSGARAPNTGKDVRRAPLRRFDGDDSRCALASLGAIAQGAILPGTVRS